MSALIYRRTVLAAEQPYVPVLRISAAAGPSQALDQLPAPLASGPPAGVEYRVEIVNAAGRSAGKSPAAFTVGGSAPAEIERLQVVASQEGAVLTWREGDAQDGIELHRVISSAADPTKSSAPGMKKADVSDAVLRVPSGTGALDRTAAMGEHYTYTVQRVRSTDVGNHHVEIRSEASLPTSVVMRDIFPPRRPTGLEAVVGDGTVDLSWEPNTEPDLAGYFVRRQEVELADLLNTIPSTSPSFQDKTAVAGHAYIYTVVAVDKAGNRSSVSEPARVSVRPDVP